MKTGDVLGQATKPLPVDELLLHTCRKPGSRDANEFGHDVQVIALRPTFVFPKFHPLNIFSKEKDMAFLNILAG